MRTFDRIRAGMRGLLERDDSLAALLGAYSEAKAGSGRLIFVAGEAGIGKTALVQAFGEVVGSGRWLEGACDPLFAPRPLGPFADIAVEAGGELAMLLHEGASARDVFDAVRLVLEDAPTVLVLEDVHWADEATLDVLRMLGRRAQSISALVITTYRDDELDRAHPLRMVLGELATARGVAWLELEALSREAVAQLAEGTRLDADELYRKTSGNPFYVSQALEADTEEIPRTIREAVLARTAGLSTAADDVLETVAIAPPLAETWLLEKVCGAAVETASECMATGLLMARGNGIAFRHELARMAVEEVLTPTRRAALHRRVLAALAKPPVGAPDLVRLAHHAEVAGDGEAVLQFAPAAAAQAAALGAHREAAAQYARALRFANGRPPGERAELLEHRSEACYLADDQVDAIATLQEAIECRHLEGAARRQADALSTLTGYFVCRGLYPEAEEAVAEATRLVEDDPQSPELARACAARAQMHLNTADLEAAIHWARRAIEIAEHSGDEATLGQALVTLGTAQLKDRDGTKGRETLERAIAVGRERGHHVLVARALSNLGRAGVVNRWHELANAYLPAGLEHCTEQSLDLWRINILAYLAQSQLDQGRWTDAAGTAALLLQDPRESPWPHFAALLVLALVRARRGDPDAWEALDRARAIGAPPDEIESVGALATALAEVAWIEGRPDEIEKVTDDALELALRRRARWTIGSLAHWRRRAGIEESVDGAAEPYALQLAGDWRRAAAAWGELGCPYERALALSEAGEEAGLRQALDEAQLLGARPLATIISRHLRERGAHDVPRGPRASTRANAAGLTAREIDVLRLVAAGLRNAEIAEQLFVSRKTVDHHVSAILRKLDARTRGEAAVAASRLDLIEDREKRAQI